MSRSGDFRGDDDRQTDYFTLAYARGVIIITYNILVYNLNLTTDTLGMCLNYTQLYII